MSETATPAPTKRSMPKRFETAEKFMFSGHQSFALRIAWLPKSIALLSRGVDPFQDPKQGTQVLGLGKNMVESLACWVDFFGVIRSGEKGREPTDFGRLVLGPEGFDPYLEDEGTLWLLHWQGTAAATRRLFAWHWLFNLHLESSFTYASALQEFQAQSVLLAREMSDVTLRQHLDVFLSTYVASDPRQGAVAEDLLDSPLSALGLIKESDQSDQGRSKESVYLVDSREKPTLSDAVFRFALHDWWNRAYVNDETVAYREICVGENSPGRVFRLPERDVHERLQRMVRTWPKEFDQTESNNQRLIRRLRPQTNVNATLRAVYGHSN